MIMAMICCQVAIDGVALDKARKSTAVIHNNKDPSWENEQFEFQIRGKKIKQKPNEGFEHMTYHL